MDGGPESDEAGAQTLNCLTKVGVRRRPAQVSKLLILLYPFSKSLSTLVDEVREEYKSAFQQQSVLRVDEHSCVSF